MTLDRIAVFDAGHDGDGPSARLTDAKTMIGNLAAELPAEVRLDGLFEISLLPPRLVSVREVLRHRMLELGRNALNCFGQGDGVAGTVLTRSAFETSALMFYVEKKVKRSVEEDNLGDLGDFLLKSLLGSKNNPKMPA
ncbi:MAG: hypothetical protein ACAI43_13015, partial [Phycisphaerae bacterium]